jgi:amino-acid N-acetyltransferase
LLALCGLPLDGVSGHPRAFLIAHGSDLLAGCVGIEQYGTDGLLRSLAVHPNHRSQGLGARLTRRALRQARRLGLRRVFVLTETAPEYFLRFQFRRIPREDAPPGVQGSVEFASACPATAVCMERTLG